FPGRVRAFPGPDAGMPQPRAAVRVRGHAAGGSLGTAADRALRRPRHLRDGPDPGGRNRRVAAAVAAAHGRRPHRPRRPGRSGLVSAVAVPVLLLLIPIFDTTFVTAVRLLSGRRPSQGGRDHTSHRLVAIGLSEARAVATLWALAAGGGVISLLVQQPDPSWPFVAALVFVLAMVIFAVYLARIRVYADGDLAALRSGTITPLVTNFMY